MSDTTENFLLKTIEKTIFRGYILTIIEGEKIQIKMVHEATGVFYTFESKTVGCCFIKLAKFLNEHEMIYRHGINESKEKTT